MAQKVEIPAGVINGVNATFTASAYAAGSISIWINGQQVPPGSFTEDDPTAGTFTITDPDLIPRTGAWGTDTIAVDYDDGAGGDTLLVDDLIATVDDSGSGIAATIADAESIIAEVADAAAAIEGTIADNESITAVIADSPVGIDGTVEDC